MLARIFARRQGTGRWTLPLAALKDETLRSILEEARRFRPKDRRLLLGIARQISSPPEGR